MKRQIITIDEEKCNGCGLCVMTCAEGALKLVNGKAKLIKELLCDGFGDCLGECPTGALKIEVRDADVFDLTATRQHVKAERGEDGLKKLETVALRHERKGHTAAPDTGGCPGSVMPAMTEEPRRASSPSSTTTAMPSQALRSELEQWPVQIHLVQPGATFFKGRELVVLSTCSPVASADVHWRFIRGRGVAVGCPKLDNTKDYAGKIGAILSEPSIPKVIVVRMEVPCCGGLTMIVAEAVRLSGRKDLQVEEVVVGLKGEIKHVRKIT